MADAIRVGEAGDGDDTTGGGPAEVREGDWNCDECGAHNFRMRRICFNRDCRAVAPRAAPVTVNTSPAEREGDWNCEDCGHLNYARRPICEVCGSKGTRAPPEEEEGHWMCYDCNTANYSTARQCYNCGRKLNPGRIGTVAVASVTLQVVRAVKSATSLVRTALKEVTGCARAVRSVTLPLGQRARRAMLLVRSEKE